jgi:hypothetical protein
MEKHNITINAKGKCPECKKGELLPFLKPHYVDEAEYNPRPEVFGHYIVYYRCDNCNFHLFGGTIIDNSPSF